MRHGPETRDAASKTSIGLVGILLWLEGGTIFALPISLEMVAGAERSNEFRGCMFLARAYNILGNTSETLPIDG